MKKARFTRNLRRHEQKAARRRKRKAAQACAAAALAAGAVAVSGGTSAATGDSGGGTADGLIAFDSLRDALNTIDVYTVNPDASNPPGTAAPVSQSPFTDSQPAWSPDGSRIAYISQRVGDIGPQVYVQDADDPGTAVPVTASVGNDATSLLAWSPDGRYIAFNKGLGGGPLGSTRDIWVVDTATAPDPGTGNNERQVTSDPADDANPTWSPNGTYIAFQSNREPATDYDIWRVNASGTESNPVDIAPYAGSDEFEPDYSPGSYLILFTSDKNQPGNRDVYVKPASTQTDNWRLTTNAGVEETPRFSPNLVRFTYSSTRGTLIPNEDIYVQWLLPDTNSNANPRNVTNNAAPDQHPDWQGTPTTSDPCRRENEADKEDALVDEAVATNTSPLTKLVNNQQPSSSSYGGYNAGSSDHAGGVSSDCAGDPSSDGTTNSSDHNSTD